MIINLTCHTDGCENFEISIPFQDPLEMCICGPCGQEITDKAITDGS
jgi:hypothetical protein